MVFSRFVIVEVVVNVVVVVAVVVMSEVHNISRVLNSTIVIIGGLALSGGKSGSALNLLRLHKAFFPCLSLPIFVSPLQIVIHIGHRHQLGI
jgi:hypothetical protein